MHTLLYLSRIYSVLYLHNPDWNAFHTDSTIDPYSAIHRSWSGRPYFMWISISGNASLIRWALDLVNILSAVIEIQCRSHTPAHGALVLVCVWLKWSYTRMDAWCGSISGSIYPDHECSPTQLRRSLLATYAVHAHGDKQYILCALCLVTGLVYLQQYCHNQLTVTVCMLLDWRPIALQLDSVYESGVLFNRRLIVVQVHLIQINGALCQYDSTFAPHHSLYLV